MTKYYLPPEWAPQYAIQLTWPHQQTDWAPMLDSIEKTYVEIAYHIARFEDLVIACHSEQIKDHVSKLLTKRNIDESKLHLFVSPSNDTWTRDHGPITVFAGANNIALDFQFNGWGERFPFRFDNLITGEIAKQGAYPNTTLERQRMVLEGGSIETDGNGTLLTTKECLLNSNRNPDLSRAEIEAQLRQQLGVQQILWLEHGYLAGDDTDSHVDILARFVNSRTICYTACLDRKDQHYRALSAMAQQLKSFSNVQGEPYQLIPLVIPKAIHNSDGDRLGANYSNFLIINDAVLVPVYDDPADKLALASIQECFNQREIIPIDARALIHNGGSIHCATMQIPARP